jgi:phage I-like protein
MVYEKAHELSQKYPDWIFIKHEDISTNPQEEFRTLFDKLGLDYSQKVEAKVNELTNAKNKADSGKERIHSLHRKSKDVAELWKKRLTKEEIAYVTKTCKKVAALHGYTL